MGIQLQSFWRRTKTMDNAKYCLEFLKRISFYFKSYHLVIILGDWYVILCSNWRQEYLVNTLGPLRNVLKVIFVVRCIFILGVSISPPAYHSWGDTCCSQKMFDFLKYSEQERFSQNLSTKTCTPSFLYKNMVLLMQGRIRTILNVSNFLGKAQNCTIH